MWGLVQGGKGPQTLFLFSPWLSKGESHRVGRVIAEECESLWRPRTLYKLSVLETSLLGKTWMRNNVGSPIIKAWHGL